MGLETLVPPREAADLFNNHHLIPSLLPADQEGLCHPLALMACIFERAINGFTCHINVIAQNCLVEGEKFNCLRMDLV